MASGLNSASARAILGALIAAKRDLRALADLAKGRVRVKIPQLAAALAGASDAAGRLASSSCTAWRGCGPSSSSTKR